MLEMGNIKLSNRNAMIFFLDQLSRLDYSIKDAINGIEYVMSVKSDNSAIIIETYDAKILSTEDISLFYDIAQTFLDIIFFRKKQLYLIDHAEPYIIRNVVNNKEDLNIKSIGIRKILTQIKMSIRDVNGKIIENKGSVEFTDFNFLRYLRMSYKTDYLVDAYRYLYLSFESALNMINPKKKKKEKQWLEGCFQIINQKYNIDVEFNKNSMFDFFYRNHYKKYRVKLFHSKEHIIKPFDFNEMKDLYKSYIELNEIHKFILEKEFGLSFGGGTVLTEAGFDYISGMLNNISLVVGEDEDNIIRTNELITDDREFKTTITFQMEPQKFLKFDSAKLIDNEKNIMVTEDFKEDITISNIDVIKWTFVLIILNRSVFDRKFNDYYFD